MHIKDLKSKGGCLMHLQLICWFGLVPLGLVSPDGLGRGGGVSTCSLWNLRMSNPWTMWAHLYIQSYIKTNIHYLRFFSGHNYCSFHVMSNTDYDSYWKLPKVYGSWVSKYFGTPLMQTIVLQRTRNNHFPKLGLSERQGITLLQFVNLCRGTLAKHVNTMLMHKRSQLLHLKQAHHFKNWAAKKNK